MIKIALFAAVQIVLYFLTAYIAWDLAWVVSLGEEVAELRFVTVSLWALASTCACLFIWHL